MFQYSFSNAQKKKAHSDIVYLFALNCLWALLGSNQKPPYYESGAKAGLIDHFSPGRLEIIMVEN